MSLLESSPSRAPASTAVVAAAILVHRPSAVAEAVEAFGRQVYEPAEVFVVGGGPEARAAAEQCGVAWVSAPTELVGALAPEITHVWMIHDDTRPRRDALSALVVDGERVDAAVVGSKLLRFDHPEVLESVGAATDVFDVPYLGLEQGEVDQQQYDVIRDVAFVSTASLLVRKDLLRGLGGPDPLLAAEAASIDFCQRARLSGARVVVTPSAEVLHEGACRSAQPDWHEDAGRLRAIIKAYGGVTLAWVLPLAFLAGLIEAIGSTFLGRRLGVVDFGRAWAWNLRHLPGTLTTRRQTRRSRQVGDEELFRYQLRGSSRLRTLGEDLGQRVRDRAAEGGPGPLAGLIEIGQDAVHHPGFLALTGTLLFSLVATRQIWGDLMPISGYAFPLADSPLDALRSYAGGWNTSGLGSPEPVRPAVAVSAIVQALVLGRAELAAALITLASVFGGAVGTARLLRRFGIGPYAGYAAGLVLVAGPAARFATGWGYWPLLPALALLPWIVLAALKSWPEGWRRRTGRMALLGLLTGVAGAFVPLGVLMPTFALAIWAGVGDRHRPAVLRSAAGGLLGAVLLFPWLYVADPLELLRGGERAFWAPPWFSVAVAVLGALALVAVADRRLLAIGGWGAVLAGAGVLGARASSVGLGREVVMAGIMAACLGWALLVGALLEMWVRVPLGYVGRRTGALIGLLAGLGMVAGTLLMAANGRAGLPDDQLREIFEFTANRAEGGSARALLVGPSETIPGEHRTVEGASYRVVTVPEPTLAEAWLPDPRLGDQQLAAVLDGLGRGETLRVGEELAAFGIRWVVVTGESPFQQALEVQLDLQPLSGFSYPIFQSEAAAHRAVADDGAPWRWSGAAYQGPASADGRVYLAENGDSRWGPGPWAQAGWANEVSTAGGEARFQPVEVFRLAALAVGAFALILLGAAWWGRGETR